ncbi:MAG: TIGR03546 family protein [Kangiellaceae bacterium]|nr:TIGR03546 family protein [Kangiellaceae bacterium]
MLTILVKLVKALNSEQSTGQLAIAVSLAIILGFTPLISLHNFIIILIALWFRVNLTLLIVSYPLFALIGYLLSSIFESTGLSLLQSESLIPIWESFFNTLFGRWSNFYYSGVVGSFVVSLILAIIAYPLVKIMVHAYREKWLAKVEQYKLVKALKASRFWQLYSSI